eukprot:344573-Rhodomonas_salina.3
MHPLAKWGPVVVLCSVGVGAVLRATYEEDKIKEKHFEEALFQRAVSSSIAPPPLPTPRREHGQLIPRTTPQKFSRLFLQSIASNPAALQMPGTGSPDQPASAPASLGSNVRHPRLVTLTSQRAEESEKGRKLSAESYVSLHPVPSFNLHPAPSAAIVCCPAIPDHLKLTCATKCVLQRGDDLGESCCAVWVEIAESWPRWHPGPRRPHGYCKSHPLPGSSATVLMRLQRARSEECELVGSLCAQMRAFSTLSS